MKLTCQVLKLLIDRTDYCRAAHSLCEWSNLVSETALSPFICGLSSSQPANKDYPQVSVAVTIGSRLPGGMCSFVFLCNYLSSVTLKCVPVCLCLSTIKSNGSLPNNRIVEDSATRSSSLSLILLLLFNLKQ